MSSLSYLLGQTSDGTDVVPTNDGTTTTQKDYLGELFDNPIRIFLLINNFVGAITTIAVQDKSSLDVVNIMTNAVNKYIAKTVQSANPSSGKPALQQSSDDLDTAKGYITQIGYLVDAYRFTSVGTLLFGLLVLLKMPSSFADTLGLYATITLSLGIISVLLFIANVVVLSIFADKVGELAQSQDATNILKSEYRTIFFRWAFLNTMPSVGNYVYLRLLQ
eukprot:403339263